MRIDTVLPSGINSIMRSQPSPPFPCQPPTACGLNMTIGIFAPFAFLYSTIAAILDGSPECPQTTSFMPSEPRTSFSITGRPPVAGPELVGLLLHYLRQTFFCAQYGMGQEYRLMPFKLLALQQAFGPFQSFVARRKFKRHYEDFTPIPVEKFKRRIFEGHFALGVRKCRYEAVPPKRIFRDGEIVAEARLAVFGTLIAVVVVAGAEHIRDFPVRGRENARATNSHWAKLGAFRWRRP